ncbi:MAG TPA: DUF4912 domain-containing protein [Pirellulales bacterium]|jgi:hypothetical protein|nr:DUF4912 domain-containing protein [Pirellulales bacterium]
MTASSLRAYSLKDLAQMARRRGVNGWHAMRKDQLVAVLLRSAQRRGASRVVPKKSVAPLRRSHAHSSAAERVKRIGAGRKTKTDSRAKSSRNSRAIKRLEQAKAQMFRSKDLASANGQPTSNGAVHNINGAVRDRLVLMVRGPFWLQACWELAAQSIQRAQVAMGQDWHTARPVLRLFLITNSAASSSSERVLRDMAIHGGVKNWYIDVKEAPQTYRVEIGYLSGKGRFYSLARSNTVTTPSATAGDTLDAHWGDIARDCDKIYAMSGGYSVEGNSNELQELFEERLRRPMGPPTANRYGNGADSFLPRDKGFRFDIDAEIVVHGTTQNGAHVTMQGEPVKVHADGTFHVRFDLPNRRQVIPIVACTKDGIEQRTVVLAVERNTKVMEPITRESGE